MAFGWVIGAIAAASCGGEDEVVCTGAALALPVDKKLVELNAGQQSELCDWGVCQLGGYGATPLCTTGVSLTVSPTRGRCLDQSPRNPACAATVADYTRCMAAVRANPCAETFFLGTECAALTTNACLVFTPQAPLPEGSP